MPSLLKSRRTHPAKSLSVRRGTVNFTRSCVFAAEVRKDGASPAYESSEQLIGYQIRQRASGERTIVESAEQWNACENAGMFDSGPFTRKLSGGCGSTDANTRACSMRIELAQICP